MKSCNWNYSCNQSLAGGRITIKQGFIIDLDGTLYRGRERLPFAIEFIDRIRRNGSPFLLMTNNSTRTPWEVAKHMRQLGIHVEEHEVFTSAQAAVRYLMRDNRGKRVYCIGEQGLVFELDNQGFVLTEQDADYVLQGLDRSFDYAKLERAMGLIGGGAVFVQTNPDVRLPMDNGFLPGAGSIGAAISSATGVHPVIIGKPSIIMMEYALERLGLPASEVWMVGDNLRTDMAAGMAASCKTALVLTGVTTVSNFAELERETGIRCDVVGEDLGELFALIDEM